MNSTKVAGNQGQVGRPAGFWIRFVAWFIDYAILFTGIVLVTYPLMADYWASAMLLARDALSGNQPEEFVYTTGYYLSQVLALLIWWLYSALLTSSRRQATLGKQAVGLVVGDTNGHRISFGRATGRFFSKALISWICLVGYLMAAFTGRKQALHDMIAGTYVTYAVREQERDG